MATTRKTTTNRTPTKKTAAKKAAAKKSTAKKTTAKKTTAKKPAAKKSTGNKTAARKTTAKQTTADRNAERNAERTTPAEEPRTGTAANGARKLGAAGAARSAAEQLAGLTGRQPECVVGIEKADGGWTVDLEVVESRRIPDSTDVLAIYAVDVDAEGELLSYHRVRRYIRGKGGDGEEGRR
jgi:hypothetical protein